MANQEHLDILKQGVEVWNQWRKEHADIQPDLGGVDLTNANLRGADLTRANFNAANLSRADLTDAKLREATFIEADLVETTLIEADLYRANLSRANLHRTDLSQARLNKANLSGANLVRATLVNTNCTEAILTDCQIYGLSTWDVVLTGATQNSLIITPMGESKITVDDLEVAQFIYLLLNNAKIRDVINTITSKAVLILGRFTPERKAVLDALREALRTHGYLPILFDFEKPSSRNMTETVRTLAHLSRFIIADLTDPSSIPQELYAIVPTLAIPVQSVLLEGKKEYAMSIDLLSTYHWMLPIHFYKEQADLLATLKEDVIKPAEQKAQELAKR